WQGCTYIGDLRDIYKKVSAAVGDQ
ncbi:uncharacterized protein METZ01_LOCUS252570, partial [marine metagenome]